MKSRTKELDVDYILRPEFSFWLQF